MRNTTADNKVIQKTIIVHSILEMIKNSSVNIFGVTSF